MINYIVFLRAINVGRRRIKMEALRDHFGAMGFPDAATYIQSGNVVFKANEPNGRLLEVKIETHLQQALGYDVPTMARNGVELQEIAAYAETQRPFPPIDNATLYVSFLKQTPSPARQQQLGDMATETDRFHLNGRQLYWLYCRDYGESRFTNAKIEKILNTQATRRNITTIQKIVAKYL